MPRGAKPGERRGGRAVGTPNKLNSDIKEMIVGALQDVGGREYLAARALDQPVAFMGLIGRVLPHQMAGEGGGPVLIQIITGVPDPEINVIDPDLDIPCIHDR